MKNCTDCPENEKCKTGVGDCELLDTAFLFAMISNWLDGADRPGRVVNGWRDIEPTGINVITYFAKLERHLNAAIDAGDKTEAQAHLAAIACNANILFNIAGKPHER